MDNLIWIIRMALRDFRRNLSKLTLFVSSIIAGIAALVAISSFEENLTNDINRQAAELLGADLVLTSNRPLDTIAIDNVADQMASELNFASMVQYEPSGSSRLTQVRALEGRYPFYGELETEPASALERFHDGEQIALVEKLLLAQLDAAVGDSIRVGDIRFKVEGILEKVPGQTGIVSSVAPAVYIPMAYIDRTGLVQYGSRINYSKYYQTQSSENVEEWIDTYSTAWEERGINYETIEARKQSTGRAFGNLSNFLSLVAFIALLLGSVGVGSSVNVFVKEKLKQVAVLRCIGVSSLSAFAIFLVQIVLMAIIGSILGATLGSVLQLALPAVLGDFLPVDVQMAISWRAIGIGLVTGLVISILFSILPLLKIRKASPMMTLRPSEEETISVGKSAYIVYALILIFIFGFNRILIPDTRIALGFTVFVILSFLILWGAARLLMWVLRRAIRPGLPYMLRQSLANLYRPNNQTVNLIATIGIGTAMISTLFFVQTQLLDEVRLADKEDQPNMLLFDIQDHQINTLEQTLIAEGLPIIQKVPIVTMRLASINGLDKKANEALDSKDRRSKGLYNREYRNTYRDSLLDTEAIISGRIRPYTADSDSIFISVEQGFAGRTGLEIGDEMVFNVQGRLITTYIGSLRTIKVNQVSTVFLFLFPEGVLDRAPKFHVLITKTASEQESADIQRKVLDIYPNISVINLSNIVDTLDDILTKIGFVVQFMALFSIITGFLVLVSALMISRFQRLRESILLRTIGASIGTVRTINTLEYIFLGSLATLTGLLLSFTATGLLSRFVFEITYRPDWLTAGILYLSITSLIVIISIWNGRHMSTVTPMHILRSEA